MAGKTLVRVAMNEAYWNAARVVCANCAYLNPPERRGDEFVHVAGNVGEDRVEYDCYAGPIHRLIEKLNEARQ